MLILSEICVMLIHFTICCVQVKCLGKELEAAEKDEREARCATEWSLLAWPACCPWLFTPGFATCVDSRSHQPPLAGHLLRQCI
jgi:hypothetical protein